MIFIEVFLFISTYFSSYHCEVGMSFSKMLQLCFFYSWVKVTV